VGYQERTIRTQREWPYTLRASRGTIF